MALRSWRWTTPGSPKNGMLQGYLRASIQLDGDGLGVDWSPKGRLFAVTTGQGGSRLLLFDAESAVLRWRRQDVLPNYAAPFGYGLDEVNGVRYSPSGRWIATAHQDGRVIVHSVADGAPVFAAQLHLSGVGGARRVAWSSKGDWLVSCGEDGRVNCVEYPNGKQQVLLLITDKAVWSVGWSPDNHWIAAVGEEGRAWIWSTKFHRFNSRGQRNEQRTNEVTHGSCQAHAITEGAHSREISILSTGSDLRSHRGRARQPLAVGGASWEAESTHRPCSRMRSTNRSTASASGMLNFTDFLPT